MFFSLSFLCVCSVGICETTSNFSFMLCTSYSCSYSLVNYYYYGAVMEQLKQEHDYLLNSLCLSILFIIKNTQKHHHHHHNMIEDVVVTIIIIVVVQPYVQFAHFRKCVQAFVSNIYGYTFVQQQKMNNENKAYEIIMI